MAIVVVPPVPRVRADTTTPPIPHRPPTTPHHAQALRHAHTRVFEAAPILAQGWFHTHIVSLYNHKDPLSVSSHVTAGKVENHDHGSTPLSCHSGEEGKVHREEGDRGGARKSIFYGLLLSWRSQ